MRPLVPLTLTLALVAALCGSLLAQSSAPRLHHSAPWLGRDLVLTIEGAPAFAPVRLFESESAGSQPTPYGLFELDRTRLRVAGNGQADAAGRLELRIPIPLDPSLAETPAHYQALVADPAAPSGSILSQARHLRRLGSRFYASSHGIAVGAPWSEPERGGLAIVSALTREIVATVDYDYPTSLAWPSGAAQPVFSDDFAHGAVMDSADHLVLFDPFFGTPRGEILFEGASRTIAATTGGQAVVVLEPGNPGSTGPLVNATLWLVDIETGARLASLSLPGPSESGWGWSPVRDEGYVIVRDRPTSQLSLWRIRLDGLLDLGQTAVGVPGGSLSGLVIEDAGVLVASWSFAGWCYAGLLTRIVYTVDPPLVHTTATPWAVETPTAVPEIDTLYSRDGICSIPVGDFGIRKLSDLSQEQHLALPSEVSDGSVTDMAWDGRKLWFTVPTTYDGSFGLVWFRPASQSFTRLPSGVTGQPSQVEILQDALVRTAGVQSSFGLYDSRFLFLDLVSGSSQSLGIRSGPVGLLAVGIP